MNDLWRGALGGLAGTLGMSAAMALSRRTRAMGGQVPPRKITRNVEKSAGIREHLSGPAFEASWVAQHLAYGTAAGVASALAEDRLGLPPPVVAGPLFGASLWAFSYAGWLPAAGLYPPPSRDRPSRVANMIVHHLIDGTTTALVTRVLRPRLVAEPS